MPDWTILAREEGRICPECKQPISRKVWKMMHDKNGKLIHSCWICRYAHWEVRSPGFGGDVFHDNAGREELEWIRGNI